MKHNCLATGSGGSYTYILFLTLPSASAGKSEAGRRFPLTTYTVPDFFFSSKPSSEGHQVLAATSDSVGVSFSFSGRRQSQQPEQQASSSLLEGKVGNNLRTFTSSTLCPSCTLPLYR